MATMVNAVKRVSVRARNTELAEPGARFLATMADELRHGDILIKNLRQAVEMLWSDIRVLENNKKFIAACMAEVDARTKGQPFRLDTSSGPVFLDEALWRFAGRSGGELGDEVSRAMPDGYPKRPTWSGTWRREVA